MRRKLLRLSFLFALSTALVATGLSTRVAADAAFQSTDNVTVPIDFTATSCSGETVNISGESHVVVHLTVAPSGGSVFKTHIQFHLQGESASGAVYIANETVNNVEAHGSIMTDNNVLTSVGQLHLVSQGSTDNLVVRTTIHTTVNANGEITATSFEFETDCQG